MNPWPASPDPRVTHRSFTPTGPGDDEGDRRRVRSAGHPQTARTNTHAEKSVMVAVPANSGGAAPNGVSHCCKKAIGAIAPSSSLTPSGRTIVPRNATSLRRSNNPRPVPLSWAVTWTHPLPMAANQTVTGVPTEPRVKQQRQARPRRSQSTRLPPRRSRLRRSPPPDAGWGSALRPERG